MRIYVRLTVYVVAFAFGHSATEAAGNRDWVTDITPVSTASAESCPSCEQRTESLRHADPFNGFQMWRSSPDQGAPGSAGFGFPHFSLPMHHYTNWYRPRAATLTKCRRCEKDLFRPRGFGHLFARPCDGYRMEYTPYVLRDDRSLYGPSYIARQPDQRCKHHCEDCDH